MGAATKIGHRGSGSASFEPEATHSRSRPRGTPPPELAGCGELCEQVRVALERVTLGWPTKSVLMVGLPGVGNTVLLDQMRVNAEAAGIQTLRMEAAQSRSIAAVPAPESRSATPLPQACLGADPGSFAPALGRRALGGAATIGSMRHHCAPRWRTPNAESSAQRFATRRAIGRNAGLGCSDTES
jgi:hypothetical protein